MFFIVCILSFAMASCLLTPSIFTGIHLSRILSQILFLHSDLAVIPARILEIDNTVSATPAHPCTNISFVSSSPSQYLRKYIFEFYIHKNLSLYIYKGRGHKIQPPHQNFFNFFIILLLNISKFHIISKINREPLVNLSLCYFFLLFNLNFYTRARSTCV